MTIASMEFGRNRLGKGDRIAIVGAGPAGVHLAHLLKRRGYRSVTLFEREPGVGGRAMSVRHDGFVHEMGACYIPEHYHEFRRLVREYDVGAFDTPKGHDRSIYTSEFDGTMREYPIAAYGERLMEGLVRSGELGRASKVSRLVQLLAAIRRYFRLRTRLLGDSGYPLGVTPSTAAAAELARPFLDVAREHRLQVMLPYFRLAQSAQGYGILETIPTLYVLLWNVPDLVTAFIKNRLGIARRPVFRMLDVGIQSVFARVATADGVDVRANTAVASVHREDDRVRINTVSAGRTEVHDVDQVIFTIDLPDTVRLIGKPTAMERDTASAITGSTFVTTLFEADRWPVAAGIAYVIDPFRPGSTFGVSGLRDVRYRFPEASAARCAAVAYQYADRLPDPAGETAFAARFDSEMATLGFTGVHAIQRKEWPYFLRFTGESIARGVPWRLFESQGTQRTWYAGSSACFESLNDVMRYNLLLLERYAE